MPYPFGHRLPKGPMSHVLTTWTFFCHMRHMHHMRHVRHVRHMHHMRAYPPSSCPAGRQPQKAISGVVHLQGRWPAAVFYPVCHPTLYAYGSRQQPNRLTNKQGDRLIPRCEGRAVMESRRNQVPLPPPLLESIATLLLFFHVIAHRGGRTDGRTDRRTDRRTDQRSLL
jgi:hypothetical protein